MKKAIFTLLCSLITLSVFMSGSDPVAVAYRKSAILWHADYDIKSYKIDIEVNDTNTYVAGSTTIFAEIENDILSIFQFELHAKMAIDSILAGNVRIPFKREGDLVKATLPNNKYHKGSLIDITIFYKGKIISSGFFSPVANRVDTRWKIPVTWSLSQPFGAKYWFPCKQLLSDKADSASIFITVPNRCKAGSNGILTKVIPVGKKKTRYEWKTSYPIAYYLISFAVADYKEYNLYAMVNKSDSVLVQNYVYNRPDYLEVNRANIDQTKDFIKYFSDLFGKYPFHKEKYGHCLSPMGGGMENQTMTTLSSFEYTLVAHELTHQWFGNQVSCASWQDVWINEGFASYGEYLALEKLKSANEAYNWIQTAYQSAMNEPAGSVYIPVEDCEKDSRIFSSSLSYKKGAAIIHMLRNEIANDSIFFTILRTFLSDFNGSVATADDFFNTVKKITGQKYEWFKNQWFYGKGYPLFNITWQYTDNGLKIKSKQTTSSLSTPFFRTHFDVKVFFNRGDTILRLNQDKPEATFDIPVNKEVIDIDFDPMAKILKKASVAKIKVI